MMCTRGFLRAAELETKKKELESRAEAVEARRVAGLAEIKKKAEVFGTAWSPARQEQVTVSPGIHHHV